ncbi:MAG: hypothetical protein N2C14_25230, partial [Planctomycetales bacterium]
AAALERRMEDSQELREAVAQVTELTQAIRVACAPQPQRSAAASRDWKRRLEPVGWMSAGAAMCLTVVLSLQSFTQASSSPAADFVASPGEINATPEINSSDEQPNVAPSEPTPALLASALAASSARFDEADELPPSLDSDEDASMSVHTWLLTALEHDARSPMLDDEVQEN